MTAVGVRKAMAERGAFHMERPKRRPSRRAALAGLLTLALPLPAFAAQPQGALRKALLDAARIPCERDVGAKVKFVVEALNVSGDWAFLYARMVSPSGGPVDFRRGPLAEAAAEGMASDSFAALLKKDGGGWRVVEHATAPTDVAWEPWGQQHGAPREIFAPR